jgi:hypothetical protein
VASPAPPANTNSATTAVTILRFIIQPPQVESYLHTSG